MQAGTSGVWRADDDRCHRRRAGRTRGGSRPPRSRPRGRRAREGARGGRTARVGTGGRRHDGRRGTVLHRPLRSVRGACPMRGSTTVLCTSGVAASPPLPTATRATRRPAAWTGSPTTCLTDLMSAARQWRLPCGCMARRGRCSRDDDSRVRADALVLTAPVPQSASLLITSDLVPPDELRSTDYDRTLALLVVLDGPGAVPPPGAVQDADATFSFVADNQAKGASSVPALTLHASGAVSRALWDERSRRDASATSWRRPAVARHRLVSNTLGEALALRQSGDDVARRVLGQRRAAPVRSCWPATPSPARRWKAPPSPGWLRQECSRERGEHGARRNTAPARPGRGLSAAEVDERSQRARSTPSRRRPRAPSARSSGPTSSRGSTP